MKTAEILSFEAYVLVHVASSPRITTRLTITSAGAHNFSCRCRCCVGVVVGVRGRNTAHLMHNCTLPITGRVPPDHATLEVTTAADADGAEPPNGCGWNRAGGKPQVCGRDEIPLHA